MHSQVSIPITLQTRRREGVTIMATSEHSIDFAHVSFTKKELGLGLGEEIHEIREYKNGLSCSRLFSDIKSYGIIGITKRLTSEAETPALELSFTIIGVPKEEVFGGDMNDDERVQIGMSILRLRKRKRLNIGSSGARGAWHYIAQKIQTIGKSG